MTPKLIAVERARADALLAEAETRVMDLLNSSSASGCEAAAERRFWEGVRHALAELMPEFMPEGEGNARSVLDLGHISPCPVRRIGVSVGLCSCGEWADLDKMSA